MLSLSPAITAAGIFCSSDEPLSRRGTWRVGGPAACWAQPDDLTQLTRALTIARDADQHTHVVGLGSNALFSDAGLTGLTLRLSGALAQVEVLASGEADVIEARVGAGAVNAHVVRTLLARGLVGAEFLSLIPGTFGGAVVTNAGTRAQEIASILRRVSLLVPSAKGWSYEEHPAEALQLSYRHAALPEGALVVGGVIALAVGDADAARERVRADKERRNLTQPYRLASVGSTFANPPGDYAGRLIEAVGLKGHAIGGAQVSALHANFLINREGATAQDFLRLMARARVRVRQRFGVTLRPEVQFVGFDGWAALDELERHEEQHG